MSLWSRIANLFRGDSLSREIDEELQAHLAEAVAQGRDPTEARRAFGSALHRSEESRDIRLIPWIESLRADAVFGWRQLSKRKATSAAAILSLALAIGACTSAFRLIDAILLRPLPVAQPQRLYTLYRQGTGFTGKPETFDGWAYPAFRLMRDAVKDQAELLAVSYSLPMDLTYKSDQEMEKARLQYVSGSMFSALGLQPALGRLLTPNDDDKPGAHPVAALSYDYWTRRFNRDPQIIGRAFQMGDRRIEIVGVGPEPFTGTEPGAVIDVFLPTMMNPSVVRDDTTWHRTLALVKPGAAMEPLRAQLDSICRAFERERASRTIGITKRALDHVVAQNVMLESAAAGASGLQQDYRRSLIALAALVGLVLLIACANVANLMAAQAAARAREMALRVSIGAGRGRLVQLVLVESAMLAFAAAALGGLFAWGSAPFVVSRINPPDNPARLSLPADWRVFAFGLALTLCVTLLFGLAPALRASAVKPMRALKGSDAHSRRRLMHVLIAVQVAFCFVTLFSGGLFVVTFDRMANAPIGFSTDRLLLLDTVASTARPPVFWDQAAEHLRSVPGVESVTLCWFPLLDNNSWNGFVSVNGAPPSPVLAYFMMASPGWLGQMKIPFLAGNDLRANDTTPGTAIVNETFVKQYLHGENPIGQSFVKDKLSFRIVGVVRDTPYRGLREPILPVAFVPFHQLDAKGAPRPIREFTFVVRTQSANPLALASTLRREVARAQPGFRVSNARTQLQLVQAQTVRERLLAMLGLFFAAVSLLLAGVGLYGVLDYSVLQRRKEIGIRMAIGAQPVSIARLVTTDVLWMVAAGALAGVALGLVSARYIETLFYQVKATDPAMLAIPALAIVAAAMLAALPAVIHALRIDPVTMLRSE
jgi:putative ABC transport system permease protein